jgi:hypothetical protein
MNDNGSVYQTNHPVVNDDVKDKYATLASDSDIKPDESNSYVRFTSLKRRVAAESELSSDVIANTLSPRDDDTHPVCRTNQQNGGGFTFASIIMTMADPPFISLLASPPDES